jgi:A/G-specific adenine glycosylase
MSKMIAANPGERCRFFREQLLLWGACHDRAFPWRSASDPYHLLIAEMMLRRTQARQVVPVYKEFLRHYPTPDALVAATEEEVARLLRPLGLSWRIPAFRQMAQRLVIDYDGVVPRDRKALLTLPGVGDYVTDAVRCFAYHESVALLDTNTVRVAGRYFGFPVHAESRRRVPVKRAVACLVDPQTPRASNLALLDLAASVCRPRQPRCAACPVATRCAWWQAERLCQKDTPSYGCSSSR